MRQNSWARCWLEGAGAAILLTPGVLWSELSRTHIDLYHRLLPLTTVARALAVDLILLSLVAMVVIRFLDAKESDRGRRFFLLLWALWLGFLAARAVAGAIVAQVLVWQQITTARAFLLTFGLGLLLWLMARDLWAWVVRVVRVAILLLGFCIVWMVPMLVVASLAHQPHDQPSFQKTLPAPAAPHARIVWLLFDEMSYEQVFAHRYPGLRLPQLDRLRGESVTFSNVQPDGFYTEDVIPSLLLGKPIDQVRGTPDGWMLYRSGPHAPWQRFDGSQTLFADAEQGGWTTGAVGSYNPYCRILKEQLDSCWMDLPPLPDHLSGSKSTLANVIAPLAANWTRIASHSGAATDASSSPDAIGAVQAASDLIADPSIDLCFLHLPMPHPPGDYHRDTGRIGSGGSYIDNLALADRVLGRMLAHVAATPAADRTIVIVSSDHSWRTFLWRNAFGWTREDEQAFVWQNRKFEPQPMLMVRFPGETNAQEIRRPVPLLALHALIEQMMAGKVEDPQSLATWADAAAQP